MQGIGHRVSWHAVDGRNLACLLKALGKERLFVIDGDIDIGQLHALAVTRKVERVRLAAVTYLCRLESSLYGGVLLGRGSITRQRAQHLIGCTRLA